MIHIRVPATSANMGPGFDSLGIALNMYNHIYFEEIEEGFEIELKRKQSIDIPVNKNNIIYKTIFDFYLEIGKTMPGIKIIQKDYIPIARGLGSSAACIVAGLMAANYLSGYNYSKYDLAKIASKIEGHSDNTNPALFGSMVISAFDDYEMKYVKLNVPKNFVFVAMIPDFPVSTKDSRNVLPKTVSINDAIYNSSRVGLLVASIMNNSIDNLKMALDDKIHQPYRKHLIPRMKNIFEASESFGAVGTYLSGAGSTLMAIVTKDKIVNFEYKMKEFLKSMPNKWDLKSLNVDTEGAIIVS